MNLLMTADAAAPDLTYVLTFIAAFGGPVLFAWASILPRRFWPDLSRPGYRSPAFLFFGAAGGVMVIRAVTALQAASWELLGQAESLARLERENLAAHHPDNLCWIALILILAPLLEEGLFRGGMLAAARKSQERLRARDFLINGTLFSLIHGQLEFGFLPRAALGAYLAWLAWRTRSLLPCVVAHSAINFVVWLRPVPLGLGDWLLGLCGALAGLIYLMPARPSRTPSRTLS